MKNKETRDRMVCIRLSDEEYDHLARCLDEAGGRYAASTYIRDLIRDAKSPLHDREQIAAIRKIQTDLRFCLVRIMRECSDTVVTSMRPIFESMEEQLRRIGGG